MADSNQPRLPGVEDLSCGFSRSEIRKVNEAARALFEAIFEHRLGCPCAICKVAFALWDLGALDVSRDISIFRSGEERDSTVRARLAQRALATLGAPQAPARHDPSK